MIKLYQYSFLPAFSFSLLLGFLWFNFIAFITQDVNDNSFFGAAFIGMVAPLLCFVFLLKLPEGRWWQKLAYEFVMLLAGLSLVTLLYAYIYSIILQNLNVQIVIEGFLICFAVSFFSQLAVRIFARPYVFWQAIRHRRLVWEITHAQLRFILLGVAVVFVAVLVPFFFSTLQYYHLRGYSWFVNALSLTVIYAGFLGIITGILLLVLVFPAIAVSYFTARRISSRIEKLMQASTAIRRGQYGMRVEVEGEDEVAALQLDFNAMAQELENALSEAKSERDAVAKLLESRRRLFANVSHELRTPIAMIRLRLEQAQKETQSDKLDLIEADILRLQRLIDDVFILVQADNRQLSYEIKAEKPLPILEALLAGIREQAWLSKKVDVLLEAPPEPPMVMVDKARLAQVLLNLLRNAIRHTPPGGLVVLRLKALENFLEFEVCDTGEGIPEAELPYIWERFYRGEQSRSDEPQGLGLGLALVKEMLETMGGSIHVESRLKEGTCFRFTLPRCDNFATIA